jgi:LPXTG-motif cell wall-anchored protein
MGETNNNFALVLILFILLVILGFLFI